MTTDVNILFPATSASEESVCKRRNILAFSVCITEIIFLTRDLPLINMCCAPDTNINSLRLSPS